MHPKDLHLSDTKTAQQKMMRLKIPGGSNVLSLSHTSQSCWMDQTTNWQFCHILYEDGTGEKSRFASASLANSTAICPADYEKMCVRH